MNSLELALRGIAADLGARGPRWALVGGLAVSVRAEPRFTRDVDVAVVVESDAAAEALTRSLTESGYRLETLVEQDATNRLATVRLACPDPLARGTVVDLLFASAGIEAEIVAGSESLEVVPGLVLPVASTGHLVALKLLARDDRTRPQDAADLVALAPHLSDRDRDVARQAIDLIVTRGFDRGRDLRRLLAEYLTGAETC